MTLTTLPPVADQLRTRFLRATASGGRKFFPSISRGSKG